MLFFCYLFDISSLRMNPCSPRFVYLFVVLRTLVRAVNFHNVKVQKKVHPRKFNLSIRGQIQHELVRFSAREEKQKMLLCCFVVLLH